MTFQNQCDYVKSCLQIFTKDDYLLDELTQMTNIKIYVGKFKMETENQYKKLLKTITKSIYIDHYRKVNSQKSKRIVYEEYDGESNLKPDSRIITKENNNLLFECIDTLSEKQKEIIYLRYYCGLNYLEISKIMKCPKNTALGYMHDAKRKLKILLTKKQFL